MSINYKDLREGDRVRISMDADFIHQDSDGDWHFRFGSTRSTWFPTEVVSTFEITRTPKPIKVGDRVECLSGRVGIVKAIDGDEVWFCEDGDNGNDTVCIGNLTRIEA